ncbi:MAG: amphi-Trp domain-containing protein [Candidatus Coatesbacteria bacterium]|nr:amphi-Trp domain-containing protein [Candidatus Coatesbacteria bacterium]
MPNENTDFVFESLQDLKSIVKYLNAISDGFSKGKIILGSKDKKIVLEPAELLKLEVKAKKKDNKVKISVKCSWKENDDQKEFKSDNLSVE